MNAPSLRAVLTLLGLLLLVACPKAPAVSVDADGCPKDFLAARGTKCAADRKMCGAETGTGHFSHFLLCQGGKWVELEAAPH